MLNLLTEFALDAWLIARFGPELTGEALEGRAWERAVASLLYRPGFTRRQAPGSSSLFGLVSASGVRHEIDGAADGWRGSLLVECKATAGGVSKADVALFHHKVMDFYERNIVQSATERWWRTICATNRSTDSARAMAISLGIIICEPARIPLPVLLRAAGNPSADMHLPEALLQELVRLGERALRPQQERYRYQPAVRQISYRPDHWSDKEIADLLWLEDEVSDQLLARYGDRRPAGLLRRARSVVSSARKVA